MFKKFSNILVITVWILAAVIWILSLISPLEITKELYRNICAILAISGLIYLILYLIPFKKRPKNIIGIVTVFSVVILGVYSERFPWKGNWDRNVLYNHGHFKNKTIESQIREIGTWKFEKRIVRVTRLTDFLIIAVETDTMNIELPWVKPENN